MTKYVRVTWKATGHESSIPRRRLDPAKHRPTSKPAVDRDGVPLPPKYHTTVAKAAVVKKKTTAASGSQHSAPIQNGPQADITKESD